MGDELWEPRFNRGFWETQMVILYHFMAYKWGGVVILTTYDLLTGDDASNLQATKPRGLPELFNGNSQLFL